MSIQSILPLLSGIVIICTGLFVLSRNPKSKLNILFFLECFTLFIWVFGYSRMYATEDKLIALRWARIGYVGIIFIPPFFYHFYLEFLKLQRKKAILLMYLLGVFFLLISQTNIIYQRLNKYFWGWYPYGGIIYPFYVLFFFGVFIRELILLYTSLRKIKIRSSIQYNQLKYLFVANIIACFGGVDYIAKFGIRVYPFGYVAALGWILIVAYAIIKYRLLDINLALTRAGIFVIVYTFVLGIPFFFGYRYGLWRVATWIMLALATSGPLIYNSLRKRAETILRKEQLQYQEELRDISSTMMLIKELERLLRTIVLRVVDIVKVSWAGIYLKDERESKYILKHQRAKIGEINLPKEFSFDSDLVKHFSKTRLPLIGEEIHSSELKAGLAVPCFIEDNLLGFLLLGDKPKGRFTTSLTLTPLPFLPTRPP